MFMAAIRFDGRREMTEFILVNLAKHEIVLEAGVPIIIEAEVKPDLPVGFESRHGYAFDTVEDSGFLLDQQRHHRVPHGHEVDTTRPSYAMEQTHLGRVHRRCAIRPIKFKKSKAKK